MTTPIKTAPDHQPYMDAMTTPTPRSEWSNEDRRDIHSVMSLYTHHELAVLLVLARRDFAAAQEARQAAEELAAQNAKNAERWKHWRTEWRVSFITAVFGGGCINKTVEMAEAHIDAAIAEGKSQGTSA